MATISDIEKIGVVGLGYVGLPVAVELAKRGFDVVGFDIGQLRIDELRRGFDRTGEISHQTLSETAIHYSDRAVDLADRSFFIVTVPTPVDKNRQPDLGPILSATEIVAGQLQPGTCVVYESTVYPGVTEDICRELLAKVSGLQAGKDFFVGYSPERINPGDREHSLTRIVKIVAGEDTATRQRIAEVYGSIIDAGLHLAPSIRVAEAAKVIENTQRDLNIALMNELAIIFDLMGISSQDVLAAAGTKWNFLKFTPGLVGGHCIGVDPYYLTAKAEELGYHPEVILAGRRINDGMGRFIAQKFVKLLVESGCDIRNARVAVFGITFKENVPDIRNSRVIDVIQELRSFGIEPLVVDPLADGEAVHHEYGLRLTEMNLAIDLDGLILACPHAEILEALSQSNSSLFRSAGVFVDVKSALRNHSFGDRLRYWSL